MLDESYTPNNLDLLDDIYHQLPVHWLISLSVMGEYI
jgi:hypothetical protein